MREKTGVYLCFFCSFFTDVFPAEIDNQVNKLTQLIPVFDVGKGPVSAACRKQAQNYQSELKRFSLWALKSEQFN